MVTISHKSPSGGSIYLLLHFFLPALLLFMPQNATPQGTPVRRRVEILWSDAMENETIAGRERRKLNGHVSLKHNDLYMTCDSAWYYDDTNQVYAFSSIHIHQGDTIHIYGRYLAYNGDTGKAVMTDSVELVDRETHLLTRQINYDTGTQIADYNDGGLIYNGKNKLTSLKGIYYAEEKMMHFRDSVRIINPDYVMTADTMMYNTKTETVWFTGPTEAVGDSIYLYCENGWSDTKNNISRLMKNAVLDNHEQRITGDTLHYDEDRGFGEAFGNVTISDTTDNVIGGGAYAWYYKEPERFLITGKPYFTMFSDDDTTTLHADTLKAVPQTDTAGVSYRLMMAFHNCSVFSREIQARCDSLAYSFRDSVIRLYFDPIVWSRENQMTSDSIALFTKNRKADHMELYNSAFVVSCVDSVRYDQIKGKNLSGYFRDNKLYRIKITGNGEAIYYVVDGDELVGVNQATSASIDIIINDGKIQEIYQNQSPEGTFDPPLKTPDSQRKLEDFRWEPALRPTLPAERERRQVEIKTPKAASRETNIQMTSTEDNQAPIPAAAPGNTKSRKQKVKNM